MQKAEINKRLQVSSNALLGAGAMVAGIALLNFMDALVKWLVTHDVSVLHILAIRSVLIVALLLFIAAVRGRMNDLVPVNKTHQAIRALTGILAPLLFFLGLRYLPLTDTVVVFFTSTLTITLLSAVILKERVGIHRWTAVGIGYIGVVIAMKPTGGGELTGYLLAFGGSMAYAYLFLSGRYLAQTETVYSLVFYFNFGVGVTSTLWILLFANHLLQLPSTDTLLAIAAVGALAVCGHYLVTLAFAKAQASLVAPLEYTAIVWAVGLDLLIWHLMPSTTTLIGGTVIILSSLYVMYREQRTKTQTN